MNKYLLGLLGSIVIAGDDSKEPHIVFGRRLARFVWSERGAIPRALGEETFEPAERKFTEKDLATLIALAYQAGKKGEKL